MFHEGKSDQIRKYAEDHDISLVEISMATGSRVSFSDFIMKWVAIRPEPVILYTIQSYNTGREHQIACENDEVFEKICALRFGYTRLPRYNDSCEWDWLEPNWCIRSRRIL